MIEINKFEAMAKLSLNEDEHQWIENRVKMLIESFETLQSVDTGTVEPLVSVLDLKNILRDDVSAKFISRDELLANAPQQYEGYFQVPKIMRNEE